MLALAASVSGVAAQRLAPAGDAGLRMAVAMGSAFTYQGRLIDGGAPAAGTVDLRFTLLDALDGGNQMGGTVVRDDVAVADGLFTVLLDFGSGAFTGEARWLEIAVRPGTSASAYTALSPRQPLTPAPYAIYASAAGTAASAATAGSVPWSGLTGVPAAFADGVDHDSGGTITGVTAGSGLTGGGTSGAVTLSIGLAGSGTASTVARSDHHHDGSYQGKYRRIVLVSPANAPAQSGADLLNALAAIVDASANNPYLLKVEPGVYDLGNGSLTMKPYVDVEGSGELATRITAAGSASAATATVVGASNAELRSLTVENAGGSAYATAISNSSTSPRLTYVTAVASGGSISSTAVSNTSSSPEMTHVTATASGTAGGSGYGVFNQSSSPVMTSVTARASGGAANYAVYNGSSSSPVITNGSASASGATASNYGVYNTSASPSLVGVAVSASGGAVNYGVANTLSSAPTLTNLTVTASGGGANYGVENSGSSPTLTNVTVTATGGSGADRGISNLGTAGTVTVHRSGVSGDSNSIYNASAYSVRVGASQLVGPVGNPGGASFICIGVYDGTFAALGAYCS